MRLSDMKTVNEQFILFLPAANDQQGDFVPCFYKTEEKPTEFVF